MPRRSFLQLTSAALAAAGVEACTQQVGDRLMPYTRRPVEVTPGIPLQYATSVERDGFGVGLVVESWQGHPTKVEGNPDHPMSLGATDALSQAEPAQLYFPERTVGVKFRSEISTWRSYLEHQLPLAAEAEKTRGAGLWFLLEPTASPLLGELRDRIRARFPEAHVRAWSPLPRDAVYQGTRLAFGRAVEPRFELAGARVVVAFEDDFLARGPGCVREAHDFAQTRAPGKEMSRLYVVESGFTPTGMFADHRLRVKPSQLTALVLGLARALAALGVPGLSRLSVPDALEVPPPHAQFFAVAARDLATARPGRAVVRVGPYADAVAQAVAHAINVALGSAGKLERFCDPLLHELESGPEVLDELLVDLAQGRARSLVITAWNPAYTAPGEMPLLAALPRCPNTVYGSLYTDATSPWVTWHVSTTHPFEHWSDTRALDGTVGIVQPLIRPLFDGHSEAELLSPWAGVPDAKPYEMVRALWQKRRGAEGFEDAWERWLALGVIPDTAAPDVAVAVDWAGLSAAVQQVRPPPLTNIEVRFAADPRVLDGRHHSNRWLQELPDVMTKVTWGNAVQLGEATAARLGIDEGTVLQLSWRHRSVDAPVYILPGHAEDVATLTLGYGQVGPFPTAQLLGYDAYTVRPAGSLWWSTDVRVQRTDAQASLATTQLYGRMDGRDIAVQRTRGQLDADRGGFLHELKGPVETLYDPYGSAKEGSKVGEGEQWAMAIDLNRCTGCSACVVACQSENNVPVVGKEDAGKGRVMHWLRIDRYFLGEGDRIEAIPQPLMCVHCEMAPCEYVCPVNATVHSDEGLNLQVYNRCVGTRFCSNNCPYKVRRFNWMNYAAPAREQEPMPMARNRDVTVRSRGVMEKCTYCVQRISRARIDARIAHRPIDVDSLTTACAQACPTRAIVFGSLTRPSSDVAKLQKDPRAYDLLHDAGTRPRTMHLARIKNPNPELA